MTTAQRIQDHLNYLVQVFDTSEWKAPVPQIVCKDGTTISVQASAHHYCSPRTNFGPYTHVEVWCATVKPTQFDYDEDGPTACVPIEKVAEFIDAHGGFNENPAGSI